MNKALVLSIAVLSATQVQAQTDGAYLIISSNIVSPSVPSTTIEIWARWTGPNYFFGGSNYDLTASDGIFSDPATTFPLALSDPGVVGPPNTVTGAAIGQLTIGQWVIEDNPVLLATYRWTATDFTARQVRLHTLNTSIFVVAHIDTRAHIELYPNEFTPGAGVINVVPAPAAWLALALPLVAAGRRRRC